MRYFILSNGMQITGDNFEFIKDTIKIKNAKKINEDKPFVDELYIFNNHIVGYYDTDKEKINEKVKING